MIEKDTVRLLRECDAGVKMGIDSIEDVTDNVKDEGFRRILEEAKRRHKVIEKDVLSMLDSFGDDGKKANPVARGMSHVMTEMKLVMNGSDATVADLMTDGCNMGVKSLCEYKNAYKAADEKSVNMCEKLCELETRMASDLQEFL